MALTTRTNGSAPVNIVAASWWNDFKDLLTGVMTDQAVDINNSVNVNSLITNYGNAYGIYIADSFGAPQRAMHVHTDGDLHLIPSPVNNKLRITKNSYAYDIAVFDASGTNGATTLNGTLTLTGGAASITCSTINATSMTVGTISPTSVTTTTVTATTVNTANLNVSGNQIYFTGGNNGSMRNPAGGALELSAGGSGAINFYTGNFASNIGGLDHTGALSVTSILTNSLLDAAGTGHLIITTGVGAITRLADPTKLSFQVPGGSEEAYITNTAIFLNNPTTIGGTLTVNGDSGLSGQLNFTGGNSGGIRNPTGGALELSAGGSAGLNFFTGNFAANIASIDNTGKLTVGSLVANNHLDSTGVNHIYITTGGGAVTRIQDPLKISFQVPGGSERFYVNATDVHSNLTFTSPVVRFGLGGYSKVNSGSVYASSGNSFNFSHGLGNALAVVHMIQNSGVLVWITATNSTTVSIAWAGGTPPYNVAWSGWLGG